MSTRENPSMRLVIDLVEKHGSMRTGEMKEHLPLSETAIYRACVSGVKEGYLAKRQYKKPSCSGRKYHTYRRTKKPYAPRQALPKSIQNRVYRERAAWVVDEKEAADVVPFRHWMDSALFGSYPKEFTPTITTGRVFRQSMTIVDDELEAAA
ncbi:MAG TPA: hypothetical protein VF783_13990 [Terriglobales bacterium]